MVSHVFKALEQINKPGKTILLVEQKVIMSLKSSQRGYVLENGLIALSGNSQDLIQDERTKRAYLGT